MPPFVIWMVSGRSIWFAPRHESAAYVYGIPFTINLCDGDIHWSQSWPGGANGFRDLCQADFRYLIVMVDVTHAKRATVVAGEEDLVALGYPDRRLVSERERRVRGDGADRGARTENLEEIRVEDLEKWRSRVRRVEVLVECVGAERAVVPEHSERERVDELH